MDEISTNEHVSEETEAATQTTRDQAVQAVERTQGVIRTQIDQRSTQAGQQVSTAAETLRQTANQLRQDGDSQKARYARIAHQGADRLERLGGYLTNADADELLARIEAMGRKQPWLVAAGGLVGGLAAARFLKASSKSRYHVAGKSSGGTTTGAWERSAPPPPSELEAAPSPDRPLSWEEQGVGAYRP
jgi:hypothetical protein